MAKKKKLKKKLAKGARIKQVEHPTLADKPYDFGGIPDRNLKKSLGC